MAAFDVGVEIAKSSSLILLAHKAEYMRVDFICPIQRLPNQGIDAINPRSVYIDLIYAHVQSQNLTEEEVCIAVCKRFAAMEYQWECVRKLPNMLSHRRLS